MCLLTNYIQTLQSVKNLKRCFWRRVLHQKRFSSLTQGTEGCFVTVFVVVVVDVVVVAVVVVVDVVVGVAVVVVVLAVAVEAL